MATLSDRLPRNVPGAFYVDTQCVDCDLCRSVAPSLFARDDETGFSYVRQQPANEDEVAQALEALDICPAGSIGDDAGQQV